MSEPELAGLVQRMRARIDPVPSPLAAKLWTATYLLMGLRYPDDLVASLLEGVQTMHQSTTYQRILREGRQEGRQEGLDEGRVGEARRFLRRLGTHRFGEPDPAVAATLDGIQDVDLLEALGERALLPDLKGWDDLLEGS